MDDKVASPTADREIVLTRVFDAPRELVWQAFTQPDRLTHWWGPRGFTTRTHRMDLRPGGEWRFVMIGPDGHEYENLVTYLEVTAPERLRYRHGGGKELEPVNFEVTVSLEREGSDGGRTRVTMYSLFPSQTARDFVVREYGAIEGGRQTLERLGEQLAESAAGAARDRPFRLTRVFAAPRELVWDAWTREDHLARWMGPVGTRIVRSSLDLKPGGIYHYGMQSPDGSLLWGRWTFREVVRPSRLVFVLSFSDAAGGLARHPLATDWPLETLSTVTFDTHAGKGGGTTVLLDWRPWQPTAIERATFDAGHGSMAEGWGGTFARLDLLLAGNSGNGT